MYAFEKDQFLSKEEADGDIDWISIANPHTRVHEPKVKVDGLTKYIQNYDFQFDNSFNETESSDILYQTMLFPLIPSLFKSGIVTWFAYGQTGSGKTFTMKGIQDEAIRDIFSTGLKKFKSLDPQYYISYFEIYRGRIHDLLNKKEKLQIMEDHNNEMQVQGLKEIFVKDQEELQEWIKEANSIRTTHCTVANDESSRSHAVWQITIK